MGVCPTLTYREGTPTATPPPPCPLDDCLQHSHDPLACVQHGGCGYCSSTQKCRKGSRLDQNSGTCPMWFFNASSLVEQYGGKEKTCLGRDLTGCKNGFSGVAGAPVPPCVWCSESALCLPWNKASTRLFAGRCAHAVENATGEATAAAYFAGLADDAARCNSLTTLDSCRAHVADWVCRWVPENAPSPRCTSGGSGGLAPDAKTDASFASFGCRQCQASAAVGGAWCETTGSCIAVDAKKKPVETDCTTIDIQIPCSPCSAFSSCEECAVHPSCGWYGGLAMCLPGRETGTIVSPGTFGTEYENDVFRPFQISCPITAAVVAKRDENKGPGYGLGGQVGDAERMAPGRVHVALWMWVLIGAVLMGGM